MNDGISRQGASPLSQPLPKADKLDKANGSDVVRLKNGSFKVGTSQGSFFNRTVRKLLSNFSSYFDKSFQSHAQKATELQRDNAYTTFQNVSGPGHAGKSLSERTVTVTDIRTYLNPKSHESEGAHELPQKVSASSQDVSDTPDYVNVRDLLDESPAYLPEAVAKTLESDGASSRDVYNALKNASVDLHKDNQYARNEVVGGARFKDILPPKDSVIEVNGRPFHANAVGGKYIASQGPMTEAANNDSIGHMFKMIHEQDTSTVVNLTNPGDAKPNPRSGTPSDLQVQYWPEQGQIADHGDLKVETTDWKKGDDFDVVTLRIGQEGVYGNEIDEESVKEVKIFQFHKWPDHGVPEKADLESFNRFTEAVEAHGEKGITTVHCKAGVGRTGVYITLDQLKQEARDGTLDRSNLLTRTAEGVWAGREARGKAFVQRDVQFDFIISEMEKEFDRLDEMGSNATEVSYLSDVDDDNAVAAGPTAASVTEKLFAGAPEEDIYDDIANMTSPDELQALHDELAEYQQAPNASEDQQQYYRDLKRAVERRQTYG